jgi:cathepsin L
MKNSTLYANIDLSEQQIVDCTTNQGNAGCLGGWLTNVYDYVIRLGITTETSYPYTQVDSSCKANGGSYKISSYQGGALGNC